MPGEVAWSGYAILLRQKSRALEFSWDVTAQKTAQVLETAIKNRR